MGRIKCHGGWTTLSNLLWRISYLTEPSLSLLWMLTNSNPSPGVSSCDKHPDESNLCGGGRFIWPIIPSYAPLVWGSRGRNLKHHVHSHAERAVSIPMLPVLSVCAQPAAFTLPLSPTQSMRWYRSPSGQVSLHQLVTKTTPYRHGHRPN